MRISKPRFFRQLPETVQAVQWQPGRRPAGIVLELPASAGAPALLPFPAHAVLRTPQGNFTVFAGDWIVTEPSGYRHLVPGRHFEQRYAALEGRQDLFAPRANRLESAHGGAGWLGAAGPPDENQGAEAPQVSENVAEPTSFQSGAVTML